MSRPVERQATAHGTEVSATASAPDRERIAATIRRIAREDRSILEALAAFDRGEYPAA